MPTKNENQHVHNIYLFVSFLRQDYNLHNAECIAATTENKNRAEFHV